jgi:hypothetical protein
MTPTPDRDGIPWVRDPWDGPGPAPSEDWEQQITVRRARAAGWIAAHVPNGGKRGKQEAERLRLAGVVAGFPDLLCIRDGRVVFIEMKRRKLGRLSPPQRMVLSILAAMQCEVYVCEGHRAALEVLGCS